MGGINCNEVIFSWNRGIIIESRNENGPQAHEMDGRKRSKNHG